ncbi:General transcription factor II-I repeat domain-containing protein 2A [Habropoda laboriosa]|uniref:General transcription factor II-I repeat domain-containing protein 2A n=1 Tax=Habropoda laboriosa TaxID=597456 RepID=A0A0L7QYB2_9HYME|nr:General transcription factor II-I repeat domain-containing protein 2A [Habropoda laboriosa]
MSIPQQSLAASYAVSLEIARSKKCFSDGELIKRCVIEMARAFNNETAVESFKTVSLPRPTINPRVKSIDSQIQGNLKALQNSCRFYSLCLDESTDISDVSQLLIFAKIIQHDFSINEELLNVAPLHSSCKGTDIFNALNQHVNEFIGNFDKCSAIVSDGAPAMIRTKQGLRAILKENGVKCNMLHCIIHQENLCGKVIKLSSTMKTVTKIINMIRDGNKALSHCKFQSFLEEINATYGDINLYSEIRWLSAGKTLQRFFSLRKEIPIFFRKGSKRFGRNAIAQTFNLSIVKALQYLRETKYFPSFEDCKPTGQFIIFMNKVLI